MKKIIYNAIFNKINSILRYLKLTEFISLKKIWKLRNENRYSSGKIQTSLGIIEYVDPITFCSGLEEIFVDEIFKVKDFDRETPIVIDCGSNIGLASIYFSKKYNAQVYAFEADPTIFNNLKRNIVNLSLQEKVNVFNKAIWINDRGVDFDVEGGYSGQIKKNGHELVKDTLKIPSIRLKKIISDLDYVNFLKLDIEGAENKTILDCEGVLNKIDYIFLEYHSHASDIQQLGDILNLLRKEGFRYQIKEAFASKAPFVKVDQSCGMDLQLNIFAYK